MLFALRKADNTILCDCIANRNHTLDFGVYYCLVPFDFSDASNVKWFGFYENDGTVPDVICSWRGISTYKEGTFAFDISLLDSSKFPNYFV